MSHCKYHPLTPALYQCRNCQTYTCDQCCNENPAVNDEDGRRCFICSQPMTFLGAAHSVEPFWRRLDKIYRYPLAKQPLAAIVISSILGALSLYSWWLILIPILLMTRYSFHCLDQTVNGHMQAPPFSDSFEGGLKLIFQIAAILFLAVAALGVSGRFLGQEGAFIVGLLELFALPAVFILLAVNGNISEAVNPSNIIRLISSAGAAYIVMLLFIFVMLASVEILTTLIGDGHRFIQFTVSNIISNYYTVVVFHLMGYLVFQKQDALGYYAADSGVTREPRNETEIDLAHIEVLVKEGHYDHAIDIYRGLLPKNFNNLALWDKCLRLMCYVGDSKQIAKYADQYLPRLLSRDDDFAVAKIYRDIVQKAPNYQPSQGDTAIRLAQVLFDLGDFRAVTQVLNNFHKNQKDKQQIVDAYTLLASALDRIPSLESKAANYRAFIEKVKVQMQQDYDKELKENPLAKFNKRPT